ncbi:MAG: hypothetical protein JSR00_05005 [Bacteroidetes bacterium]|nr:hypothetical protein [Bacteroidota bacterium]
MKKIIAFLSLLLLISVSLYSQCSLCTKTAAQLGEKPAQGMNSGIIYLMATPFVIMGYIGYRWFKDQQRIKRSQQ